MYLLSSILILVCAGEIFTQNISITDNGFTMENKLNYIDVLKEDLLNHHWDKEETTCLDKLLDIMNNVKNSTLWAVWIWDSMQTPAGLLYGSQNTLGNYDQCLNPPWLETHPEYRTQYCLVDVKLSQTEPNNTIGDPHRSIKHHINSVSKYKLKFNKLTWGACVPAECKTESTSKFVKTLLKYTYLGPEINKINAKYCQVSGSVTEFSLGTNFIILFFITIIVVAVTCTILNNLKPKNHDTLGSKLIKAFCLKTNSFYLNKLSKDDIKVLHGLRVLTSFMVVTLHVVLISHIVGFSNALTFDKDLDRFKLKATLRADYAVDTFLLMSGLLRIKSFMAIGKIKPFKAVLKRYLRYIVLMGICIMCFVNIHKHIGDGPIWSFRTDEESKACQKNWLIGLLMLGNYVDTDNICYPVAWTVACDFHLSVIATILYWIYEKNHKKGFTIYTILMMAALITPGIVTYQNLPIVSSFDFILAEEHKKVFLNRNYMLTHLRGGPYFIGIALGYIMSIYKPDRYRNIFSKLTSIIGFLVSVSGAVTIILIGVSLQNETDSCVLVSFLYTSLHRSIWAVAVSCIIIVCEYGTVPLLEAVFSWSFFIPLSKISYCVYLIHVVVYSLMIATTRSSLHYNALVLVLHTLAAMSLSCVFSVLLYLFVEAPSNRIIDMIDIKADTRQKNESEITSEYKTNALRNDTKKNM